MQTHCSECGDRIRENCHYKVEDGDRVECCDTCGEELMRVENVERKIANTERF